MSNTYNTIFLEAARDNFDQALEEENYGLARAIIEDLKDANFTDESSLLERELHTRKRRDQLFEETIGFLGKVNKTMYGVNPFNRPKEI